MSLYNKDLGQLGEKIAADFLRNKGFSILNKNFHSHWGEIDIVARRNNTICFVEVKTRMGSSKGAPYEAINFYKKRSFKRAVQHYLLQNDFKDYKLTMDMISIELNSDKKIEKILYFENIDNIV